MSSYVGIDPSFKPVYQVYAQSHRDLENSQPKTQVLVYRVRTKGVNKLAHIFDGTSLSAILL